MTKIKIMKTLTSVAVLAIASNSAWAVDTTAGTGVDNTASISYSVSGTPQTLIESSEIGNTTPGGGEGVPTSFIVDKRVDVNVTATAATQNIVPNGTATHTFTVTNEGNDIEFFALSDLNATTGTNTAPLLDDTFDVSSCTIAVTAVSNTVLAAIPASVTVDAVAQRSSSASPLQIVPDGTATVTLVCTAPANNGASLLVNDDNANVSLIATAITSAATSITDAGTPHTETTTADTAGIDVVLADAENIATVGDTARDASHSAIVANVINIAELTVQKTSAVVSDPINIENNPKRIPGATVRYTITVSNGGAEADHLVISDILPTNLTFVTCELTGDGEVNVAAPDAGVALDCPDTTTGTVSSTSFTLPAGTATALTTATLTIDATIN